MKTKNFIAKLRIARNLVAKGELLIIALTKAGIHRDTFLFIRQEGMVGYAIDRLGYPNDLSLNRWSDSVGITERIACIENSIQALAMPQNHRKSK